MFGTIVNTIAILVGGSIGLLFKSKLSTKLTDGIMMALGLCTLYIGINGSLEEVNTIIVIGSMVVGTLIGEWLDLEGHLDKLGLLIEACFKHSLPNGSIAQGFVSASLLFCVGAMTIVGALKSGISGDHQLLFTKSILDFISAIIFASTLGIGVLFSSVFVFAYQGSITLLAQTLAPYLTDTLIAHMNCIGSIIIIGLAFNILKITKLKIVNFIPAIFLPILFLLFI